MKWDYFLFRGIFCRGNRNGRVLLLCAVLLATAGVGAFSQEKSEGGGPPRPVPAKPFHIIGKIYYVGQTEPKEPGNTDDASYLLTTSQGLILLDTGEEGTVSRIRENVKKLGFRVEDIKWMIHSHAHSDHVAGDALMKELAAGAKLALMDGDSPVVASGGRMDFDAKRARFKEVKVDRILHDGDKIQLGDTTLVAHLTPGHTKGCTTWTMVVEDGGKKYNVVFLCSSRFTPGVPLVGNALYPGIADDFLKTYKTLRSLPCDVFLASHGNFFGLVQKAKLLEQGASPNPFIDPQGYKAYIDDSERDFQKEFRKQGGTL